MPKVPAGSGQVVPMMKPPEDVYLAMAAAQMDQAGRLFEPQPAFNQGMKQMRDKLDYDDKYQRDLPDRRLSPEENDEDNGSGGTKRTT